MELSLGGMSSWREGRRIVDLNELAKQMRCKQCTSLLDLNRTVRESRFGLASVLFIVCQCGVLNDVHTGRKQETETGPPMYEVNIKASINMLLYGMGASHVINFLAVLDIPVPPADDTSLIVPVPSTSDVPSSMPMVTSAYNPSLSTLLPATSLQQAHVLHQPQQQHQHQQHQQQQELSPLQIQTVSVPQQHKGKALQTEAQPKTGTDGQKPAAQRRGLEKCPFCQPCPHHHHHHHHNNNNKPTKKSPEAAKLSKDERDDAKVNTKCTVCKIVFRSREHYRIHKILHPQLRKKQRFKCSDCSAEFPERGKLKDHARVHTGEKPYKCDYCDKCFHKKSQRSKHVKRCHMKENSHVCNFCGKRTFTKTELREHVRVHTGERPYQCEVCDRTFRRKDYLTVHMRQHTGERPYKCQHCGDSFVQRVSLCKHMQAKHSICAALAVPSSTPSSLAHPSAPHLQVHAAHAHPQDMMTAVGMCELHMPPHAQPSAMFY